MSSEPEPMTRPLSVAMSWLMNRSSSLSCPVHSCRQKEHRNSPLAMFRLISVAPQRGHFDKPSLAFAPVSTTWGPVDSGGDGGGAAGMGGTGPGTGPGWGGAAWSHAD